MTGREVREEGFGDRHPLSGKRPSERLTDDPDLLEARQFGVDKDDAAPRYPAEAALSGHLQLEGLDSNGHADLRRERTKGCEELILGRFWPLGPF